MNRNTLKMKKILMMLCWFLIMVTTTTAQNRKSFFKFNLAGAGLGLEHFFTPQISWHNELGANYWGKITDKIGDKNTFEGKAAVNPYFISSIRYYFVPLHPVKGKWEIGWRVSIILPNIEPKGLVS
jgi:hypothetical protein